MSVSIPISADASATVQAINKIQEALKRAGQEAKALRDIDLSHPELSGMGSDLQVVAKNLQDLMRVGRGDTAAAVRKSVGWSGQYDGSSVFQDLQRWREQTERAYPDPAARQRHVANVGRYIFQGTRFAPPQLPAPMPPAPAPSPGGGAGPSFPSMPFSGGGGGGSMVLAGAKGFAGWMLAAAGLGALSSAAMEGVNTAHDEATSNGSLLRRMGGTGADDDFEKLRDSVRKTAESLWVVNGEAQRLTLSWVRLTNETDRGAAARDVTYAGRFARGYGMDIGSTTAAFGQAKFLGEDPQRFASILGSAIAEGHMGGQSEQVMQSLLRWSENASRYLVTTTNVGAFASLSAQLNATGQPGLRGAAGESLLGTIDSTLRGGGGGGEASQALIFNAFARAGIKDPYAALRMQQRGMFASVGRRESWEIQMAEIERIIPKSLGTDFLDSAIGTHFGINMDQATALRGMDPAKRGALRKIFESLHIEKPDDLNPGAMNEIFKVLGDAKPGELDAAKTKALEIAQRGMKSNFGEDVARSDAEKTNALTAIFQPLVPIIADLKTGFSQLTEELQKATTSLGDHLQYPRGRMSSWMTPYMRDHLPPAVGGAPWLTADAHDPDLKTYTDAFGHTIPIGITLGGKPIGGSSKLFSTLEGAYTLPGGILDATWAVESGRGTNMGPSSAGAKGHFQFKDDTARRYSVSNPNDLGQSATGASRYYRYLLDHYKQDVRKAIAGYNWGEGNLDRDLEEHGDAWEQFAPDETRGQIDKITSRMSGTPIPGGGSGGASSASPRMSFDPLEVIIKTGKDGSETGRTYLPHRIGENQSRPMSYGVP